MLVTKADSATWVLVLLDARDIAAIRDGRVASIHLAVETDNDEIVVVLMTDEMRGTLGDGEGMRRVKLPRGYVYVFPWAQSHLERLARDEPYLTYDVGKCPRFVVMQREVMDNSDVERLACDYIMYRHTAEAPPSMDATAGVH